MQVRKQQLEQLGHGTTDWVQVGKGVCQDCILSPCLFNLYAEYIMRNAGLDEAQAGIKISVKSIFGSLIGIALNLQIALGSILIFIILILLIYEHGIFLHLLLSSLISFTSVL